MQEYVTGVAKWFTLPLSASPWPIQMAAILLLFAVGVVIVRWFIGWQTRSVGHSFTVDYWPIIKTSAIATTIYRLGIYAIPTVLACYILSRFA